MSLNVKNSNLSNSKNIYNYSIKCSEKNDDDSEQFHLTNDNLFLKIKKLLPLKTLSILFFIFHGTLSVCMLRYVRFRKVSNMFIAPVALMVGEFFKIFLSIIFLSIENKSLIGAVKILYLETLINWKTFLKTSIPAFCYAIQNLLYYYAISYLDATLLLVLQQIKILSTAFFTVVLLKKKLSPLQWLSMLILIIGIILVQIKFPTIKNDEHSNNSTKKNETIETTTHFYPLPNPFHIPPQIIGLTMVMIGTTIAGFVGTFLEKMFKNNDTSIWARNFQLSIFSIPVHLSTAFASEFNKISTNGLFIGFDYMVLLMAFIFGVHGMVVAILLKHASSILKCFASGFVITLTALVSIIVFDKWPSYLMIVGTLVIFIAVYIYTNYPYKSKIRTSNIIVENKI
ncbi:UDP-galactose translocator [Strongyloides ratti]|uniref:UDP-galactose translocator n=1 Tax=Strongyloides ratti TaxID=34506 RepID=A0A090LMD6_STRRB|nr:UDP-galactose translocator [Strongyloides ratti]CEF69343.1 UDP-galactose translocator [Strongyloides ratti]